MKLTALSAVGVLTVFAFSSCVLYKDTGSMYVSWGGDATMETSTGARIVHSHTKSLQHTLQTVSSLGGSLALASVQKAKDASTATTQQQAQTQSFTLAQQKETDAAAQAAASAKQVSQETFINAGIKHP